MFRFHPIYFLCSLLLLGVEIYIGARMAVETLVRRRRMRVAGTVK